MNGLFTYVCSDFLRLGDLLPFRSFAFFGPRNYCVLRVGRLLRCKLVTCSCFASEGTQFGDCDPKSDRTDSVFVTLGLDVRVGYKNLLFPHPPLTLYKFNNKISSICLQY